MLKSLSQLYRERIQKGGEGSGRYPKGSGGDKEQGDSDRDAKARAIAESKGRVVTGAKGDSVKTMSPKDFKSSHNFILSKPQQEVLNTAEKEGKSVNAHIKSTPFGNYLTHLEVEGPTNSRDVGGKKVYGWKPKEKK